MSHGIDLGKYSEFDFKIVTEWIVNHSKGENNLVVALKFSNSDVKYAPRIQYLIEKQVNSMLSKGDGSTDQCNVRFFVLCDVLNPACCLDVLNIKKSHSDLVIHFGYSCNRNIGRFHLPAYFVPSSSDYFDTSEPGMLHEIATFLHNQLKNRLYGRSVSSGRTNVILSFQGILKDDSRSVLVDKVLDLVNACDNGEICLYQLSPISTTDCLEFASSEFICDLPLTKIGHNKELELGNLEKECSQEASDSGNPVLFFHFISKGNTYSSLPDSLLERIILRYNQIFEMFLCQVVNDPNPTIEVNTAVLDKLSSIISKRFVFIEKAKSIRTINRVAFIITPGITPTEWQLIKQFRKHTYRQNTDDGNKVLIETHIISLSGVSEVKLRNFPDIDIFCYFGCSEYFLSHIVKTLNLKTPIIITPFEYQVFLGVREWSTCYLNVCDLVEPEIDNQGASSSTILSDYEDSDIDQHFSKLTIKDSETPDKTLCAKSGSHAIQNIDKKTKNLLVCLNSIRNKHERTYFGLNPLENTEQIPTITQGRNGIASVYSNENK